MKTSLWTVLVLHKTRPGVDQGNSHWLRDENRLRHFCQTWEQSGWLQHSVSRRLCFGVLTLYLLINLTELNTNMLFSIYFFYLKKIIHEKFVTMILCAANLKCDTPKLLKQKIWLCIFFPCRFSGVTEEDLENVTISLRDVQAVLLSMFSAETILIGHSLESDLLALKVTWCSKSWAPTWDKLVLRFSFCFGVAFGIQQY